MAHAASGGHALARALLALAAPMTNGHGYYGRGPVTGLVAATPARAQVIALTQAIAGIRPFRFNRLLQYAPGAPPVTYDHLAQIHQTKTVKPTGVHGPRSGPGTLALPPGSGCSLCRQRPDPGAARRPAPERVSQMDSPPRLNAGTRQSGFGCAAGGSGSQAWTRPPSASTCTLSSSNHRPPSPR